MRILIVDDDAKELRSLTENIGTVCPDADIQCVNNSLEALAFARQKEIDIAYLKTDLPELDGLDLGLYLKELYPFLNVIFFSQTEKHAFGAISQHASGYLVNPVSRDMIEYEMTDLRYPMETKNRKRVYIQTFGNFEVFVDGKPIAFRYTKTKEILAILVTKRGAQTTNGELIATLWEDDGDPEKKMSYLSNLRQDLQNTLAKLHIMRIIEKQRGSLAIVPDHIECDLYDWLEKKKASRYNYLGEFMNQYSWAESMHAEIDDIFFAEQ